MWRANQQNWLIGTIGCVLLLFMGLYLTPTDQVRNDILSRISCLRVSAEFGATEVSCWEMDEVGRTRFAWSLIF